VPIQRAVPTASLASCRNGIPKPMMTPRIERAMSSTNAPGGPNRSVRIVARTRPIRPPETPATWAAPAMPAYVISRPRRVIPQPDPGRVPGPHSSHQPARSNRNGATQRIAPNHGAKVSRHHVVRAPSPGSVRAMRVIAPSTISVSPMIERTTSGVRRAMNVSRGPGRRARDGRLAGLRAAVLRRVATSDLDHDREDHRPSLRLLVQEARQRGLDLRVEQGDLADVVARVGDRFNDSLASLAHDRV